MDHPAVVLCTPSTLRPLLGLVRRAVDLLLVERNTEELIQVLDQMAHRVDTLGRQPHPAGATSLMIRSAFAHSCLFRERPFCSTLSPADMSKEGRMRRVLVVLPVVLLLALGVMAPALAQPAVPQPPGAIANVRLVANLPEAAQATSINFMTYGIGRGRRDVMIVNGRFGLQTYDLADPARPVLLDRLTNDDLRLPSDTSGTFWQNEDMNVDQRRKLVFMARDPRAYNGTTSSDASIAGVYIVDARDPADLRLITFHQLPTGHTSTCINSCDYLWTGGPASTVSQRPAWPGGRPIFVTDIRDPARPYTFPDPIDTGRNDGQTAYSHDVQVDARGLAWVSGLGGVRGYHTRGWHHDPVQQRWRMASAWDPVPYAGGGFEESAVPSSFMHNAERPVGRWAGRGEDTADWDRRWRGRVLVNRGDLLYATEEAFGSPTCNGVGQFAIASLEGSYNGEGWRSTPENPFRLRTVGTWNPHDKEGTLTGPGAMCSAHYFELRDGIVAYSWYAQGTRFIDVSDPSNPIQIAYYRPNGGVSWAPYYYGNYIYVADNARGVDILQLTDGARTSADRRQDLVAPPMSAAAVARIEQFAAGYLPDPDLGWVCVLPRPE